MWGSVQEDRESGLLRTCSGFAFGTLWGPVMVTGAWPFRTHWGFSFGTLWGSVQADGSLVSSGPIGASALGHCGVQFRLMGVWSPQDLWRRGAVEREGEEIGQRVSVCG